MSENQSSRTTSPAHQSAQDSHSAQPIGEWTPAPLPGTIQQADQTDGQTDNKTEGSDISPGISSEREAELLTLIHDLNDCNDTLLSRVSQLETALEDAQHNAQSEARNAQAAQAQVKAQIQAEMAEQMSAVQASAQQTSQNAQQQVANVVAQLEASEQALQRQQLINETLQSELANAKESVNQLEHECAMGVQRHAEEAQARVKAENTVRDLRSRLQRQQRYTLQFKAALEKSLTVTARSASPQPISTKPTSFSTSAQETANDSQNPVPMPRAQRIMPWAGAVTSPFEGIDPHLENLIRGASKPTCDVVHHDLEIRSSKALEQSPSGALDPQHQLTDSNTTVEISSGKEATIGEAAAIIGEAATETSVAEDELWQDIERVIEHSAKGAETNEASETADKSALSDAEPRLNWQENASQPPVTQSSAANEPSKSAQPTPSIKSDLKSIVIDPYTVPAGQSPADEVGFTEPSPWGKPLTEKLKASAADPSAADSSAADPNLEDSAVSPVVKPLRPQRKIGSMSAVQLPTFEKAKATSFKR
ncbi:MAG: hypothetical protein AAGN15_11730 [Cyanobacteria bacterium J06581_3]